jgi:uncharacterized membrane protein
MTTLEWDYWPGLPVLALIVLIGTVMVGGLYMIVRRSARPGRLIALTLLRVGLMLGILLCLFDPHWVHEIRTAQQSSLLLLVDTTRSMAEPDGSGTRLERAQAWWKKQRAGDGPAQIEGFDEKLHPLKNGDIWKISDGKLTSVAAGLDDVSTLTSDVPIGRVVLISDGRVTDGQDPLPAARALGARGISVSTLTVGSADSKPQLHIENIDAPNLVGRQTPVRAVVTFSAKGVTGKSGTLRISSGDQMLVQKTVMLDDKSQSVELNFTPPPSPSLQVCTATLDLADAPSAVTHEELPFALRIGDPKIRVLYMEGSQSDEMVYIQRALQQGPTPMEVTLLHRGQGPNDKQPFHVDPNPDGGEPIYNVENPDHGYPRTLNGLLQYDVIIWSDIIKEAFNDDQMKWTEQFVEQYGGGFCMVGGSTSFGPGDFDKTPIDSIIPVAMEGEKRSFGETFEPVATPAGLAHPILAVGATPEETRQIWQTKRPHFFGLQAVIRPKPGAVTLLEHPFLKNEYGPYIVVAVQEVGRGRTMAQTPDTTIETGRDFEHLWGEPINPNLPKSPSNCDTRYYRQYWINAVRWLAARRLALKNVSFAVSTSKRRVNPNDPLTIHVTWKPPAFPDGAASEPPASIQVTISDLASNTVEQTLPATIQPGTLDYQLQARLPHSGRFLVDVPDAAQMNAVCAPAIVTCDTTDPELADVRADPQLMAAIAEASGGRVLTDDSVDARQLNTSTDRAVSSHIRFEQKSIWDSGWILAALAGLLVAEWVLRRRWALI